MSDIIDFIKSVALEAGELIKTEQSESTLTQHFKDGNELVTSADLKADELICRRIQEKFPSHKILSEESAPQIEDVAAIDSPLWIIDPIDGTVNFAHGHAQSAVSIAYVAGNKISAAAVYNPFVDEMFWAQLHQGAFLNETPIHVAGQTELQRAIIATGFPYDKSTLPPMLTRVSKVLTHCADIRRLGSAALDICWVAMGRLDGFYESLSLWDFAAAQLIAREAGALYGHFNPVPQDQDPQFYCQDILVANPILFTKLQTLLKDSD